jgi:hypothetical protein
MCQHLPARSTITHRQGRQASPGPETTEALWPNWQVACFHLLFDEMACGTKFRGGDRKQEGRGESWGDAWQRGDPACEPAPLTSRTHSAANHDTPQHPKLLCLAPSHTRLRTAIAAIQTRGGDRQSCQRPAPLSFVLAVFAASFSLLIFTSPRLGRYAG